MNFGSMKPADKKQKRCTCGVQAGDCHVPAQFEPKWSELSPIPGSANDGWRVCVAKLPMSRRAFIVSAAAVGGGQKLAGLGSAISVSLVSVRLNGRPILELTAAKPEPRCSGFWLNPIYSRRDESATPAASACRSSQAPCWSYTARMRLPTKLQPSTQVPVHVCPARSAPCRPAPASVFRDVSLFRSGRFCRNAAASSRARF